MSKHNDQEPQETLHLGIFLIALGFALCFAAEFCPEPFRALFLLDSSWAWLTTILSASFGLLLIVVALVLREIQAEQTISA